jgi:O-methyltransferase domain
LARPYLTHRGDKRRGPSVRIASIHDWQRDTSVRILGNIRKVIPASGRLLVIEAVVPDGNDESPSKLFDRFMMTLPDGLERTEAQFRAIFHASGFTLTGITPTESTLPVIEARPAAS